MTQQLLKTLYHLIVKALSNFNTEYWLFGIGNLTCCDLTSVVTPYNDRSESTLAQVMACCQAAPSHYVKQCWLIVKGFPRHSSESSFARKRAALQEALMKHSATCAIKITTTFPWGQWVKVSGCLHYAICLGLQHWFDLIKPENIELILLCCWSCKFPRELGQCDGCWCYVSFHHKVINSQGFDFVGLMNPYLSLTICIISILRHIRKYKYILKTLSEKYNTTRNEHFSELSNLF